MSRAPVCGREDRRVSETRVRRKPRPRVSAAKRAAVYTRDGHACLRCGSHRNLTIDHVVPLSRGGTNQIDNLQTLCGGCNGMKKSKTADYRSASTPR